MRAITTEEKRDNNPWGGHKNESEITIKTGMRRALSLPQ